MRKVTAMFSAVFIIFSMFTGCSLDPVGDELEKFLNVDMVKPNAIYEEVKADAAKLGSIQSDKELIQVVEGMTAKLQQSLDIVNKIELQTSELQGARDKYVKSMQIDKEALEDLLKAAKNGGNEAQVNAALEKLKKGIDHLNDYNKTLEDIASQTGREVKYQ